MTVKTWVTGGLGAFLAGIVAVSCGGSDGAANATGVPAEHDEGGVPPAFAFDGAYMSLWTAEAIDGIQLDASNTIPHMVPPPPDQLFSQDFYVWDGWPIRNRDGSIAVFEGWVVYISLSAPRDPDAEIPFFTRSQWRYWFTNGSEWREGGAVFPEGLLPSGEEFRNWAGSTSYDPETGRAHFYTTIVGDLNPETGPEYPSEFPQGSPREGRPPIIQQIGEASARVVVDGDGVRFEEFSPHEIILEADGEIYQTFDASVEDQVIYGFRDPHYWRDPQTGEEFILFTANAAFKSGSQNGVVGIAQRIEGEWTLLPPIIGAPEVSSQLERPHVIEQDGLLYVLFCTHSFTFEPEGAGPEGLYGFVTDSGSIRGHYVPLNGTGLVAGNPPTEPTQAYSFFMLPGGNVISYINTAGDESAYAGNWVGAPSPIFQVGLDGATTFIASALTAPGPGGTGAGDGEGEPPGGGPSNPNQLRGAGDASDPGLEILRRGLGQAR